MTEEQYKAELVSKDMTIAALQADLQEAAVTVENLLASLRRYEYDELSVVYGNKGGAGC